MSAAGCGRRHSYREGWSHRPLHLRAAIELQYRDGSVVPGGYYFFNYNVDDDGFMKAEGAA